MSKNDYYYALGRRSSAVARVRLVPGKGTMTVNNRPAEEYFAASQYLLQRLVEPFAVLDKLNQYDIQVLVSGGGHSGQIDAIKLGIARSLALVNEDFKSTLKKANMLSRDPREKERKKFGLRKARKQRQFVKR